MKISIALTLLILLLGIPLALQDRQQLTIVRERHAQFNSRVAQSGITRGSTKQPGEGRDTHHEYKYKQKAAKKLAADVIAASISNGLLADLLISIDSLDASELELFITEILASTELTGEARRELLFTLAEVASDHPQAALAMLIESIDLTKESEFTKNLISASLAKWARKDPTAVLVWAQKNADLFSRFVDEDSKIRIIGSAAVNHPALALQLIDQIGLEPMGKNGAFDQIAQAAQTSEDRTITLKAIFAYLALLPAGKEKDKASDIFFPSIMGSAVSEGFDAATQWLDHSGMTPDQLGLIPRANLLWMIPLGETGKWVEWMGRTQSGDQMRWYMNEMVRFWTQKDPQAAGKWLVSIPEGITKSIAIATFSKSVSYHDPEMAERWAMILPVGGDRGDTLKQIYKNWPKGDETAKDAFAQRHGLK